MEFLISILNKLVDGLLSKTAIIIYLIIFLLLVLGIVVRYASLEKTRESYIKANSKSKIIEQKEQKIKDLEKKVKELEKKSKDHIIVQTTTTPNPQNVSTTVKEVSKIEPVIENAEESEEAIDEDEKPSPTGKSRFYKLTELEERYQDYVKPNYDNEITLKEICEQFRNFAASDAHHLYYSIEDIRRFIGGMAVTKLMILQGMSGTGKTSIAVAFGKFLSNFTKVIPIQPMWKERTDLIGYYNEFTRRFNETDLLETMYEANLNDEIFIVVLDEMNIARVEYYFAEFLSLLELPDLRQRLLDVVADKWPNDPSKLNEQGKILMKDNVWFIGTANNDDSTFAISDKVYDRAMVLNLDKRATTFDAPATPGLKLSATHLKELFAKAQIEYSVSERTLRKIRALDEYMIQTFHLTFGNRIMKQIKDYVPVLVACGGEELQALDDILARKVFRKLEAKNPVAVQQLADSLCEFLDNTFGVDKMALSKETIMIIKQNV